MVVQHLLVEEVSLVEDQHHRHPIGFGGSQETVDEGGGGLGIDDRDYQEGLIDVGGQDVALFGEVDALADDVVTAGFDIGDKIIRNRDPVTDRDGVGGADALEAEVALDLTINQLAIVREDGVPAACILND